MRERKFIINGSISMLNKIKTRGPEKVDYSRRGYRLDRLEFTPETGKIILFYKYWTMPYLEYNFVL